jgi:hypothetical protein
VFFIKSSCLILRFRKFVIEIWNWKTLSWMEIHPLGLNLATSITPRLIVIHIKWSILKIYHIICWFFSLNSIFNCSLQFSLWSKGDSWNSFIQCSWGSVMKGVQRKGTWDFINHFLEGLKNHVSNSNHFLWLLTDMDQQLTNSNSTVSYRLEVHSLVKNCWFS